MVKKEILIKSPAGLQMGLAGSFCDTAVAFDSIITFRCADGSYEGNAKSILSVLGACIKSGDTIEVMCDGADENIAMEKLLAVFENWE